MVGIYLLNPKRNLYKFEAPAQELEILLELSSRAIPRVMVTCAFYEIYKGSQVTIIAGDSLRGLLKENL